MNNKFLNLLHQKYDDARYLFLKNYIFKNYGF